MELAGSENDHKALPLRDIYMMFTSYGKERSLNKWSVLFNSLCSSSFPIDPIAHSAMGMSQPEGKNPTVTLTEPLEMEVFKGDFIEVNTISWTQTALHLL